MFLFFLGHGFEAPLAAGSSNGRHLLEKVVLVLSALSSAGGAAVAESLASLVLYLYHHCNDSFSLNCNWMSLDVRKNPRGSNPNSHEPVSL